RRVTERDRPRAFSHVRRDTLMLIGYVSDERYAALADVLLEFVNDRGDSWEARSRASGSVHADLPPGDYVVTLAKAGYGPKRVGYSSPHHKQFVEAPARPGLYYFHAATAAGSAFSFPWVVAPARPSAPAAVLASDLTWNAYNNFGGRSNYVHADALPPTPTVN